MKVLHTREQFNPERGTVCLRSFLFAGIQYCEGDVFHFDILNKKQVTRVRQMYQMRRVEHMDTFLTRYSQFDFDYAETTGLKRRRRKNR
jgi:hypothetical protein